MDKNIKIVFPGNPLSTQHLYKMTCMGKFARMYMSKIGVDRKQEYQWIAKSTWKGNPLCGKVSLKVKLYFGDKRARDIDNYNKIILDSLTEIVFEDDKQINKITIEKYYDKIYPRIEIYL